MPVWNKPEFEAIKLGTPPDSPGRERPSSPPARGGSSSSPPSSPARGASSPPPSPKPQGSEKKSNPGWSTKATPLPQIKFDNY